MSLLAVFFRIFSWFNFVGKLQCQLLCALASTPAVYWQVKKKYLLYVLRLCDSLVR